MKRDEFNKKTNDGNINTTYNLPKINAYTSAFERNCAQVIRLTFCFEVSDTRGGKLMRLFPQELTYMLQQGEQHQNLESMLSDSMNGLTYCNEKSNHQD